MRQFGSAAALIVDFGVVVIGPAHAVSNIGKQRDIGEVVNCAGLFRGSHTVAARTPAERPKVRRQDPAEWSMYVAAACPKVCSAWARASRKTTTCGYYSSNYRYTCTLIALPARKKRR